MNVNASTRRFAVASLAVGVLAGVILAGCAGGGGGNPDSRLSLEQATEPLTGAPPQLAEIRGQANQLLDGGKDAFDQRIEALQGTPIVVNDWASWCGPCRFEFPFLQSQAAKHATEIAFLERHPHGNVAGRGNGKEKMRRSHPWCRPEGQQ